MATDDPVSSAPRWAFRRGCLYGLGAGAVALALALLVIAQHPDLDGLFFPLVAVVILLTGLLTSCRSRRALLGFVSGTVIGFAVSVYAVLIVVAPGGN